MKKEKIKIGDICYGVSGEVEYIFKKAKSGSYEDYIGNSIVITSDGGYHSPGMIMSMNDYPDRLATPEEKQWLKACEKAGEFVSKEKALQGIVKEQRFEVGKWYKHSDYSGDCYFKFFSLRKEGYIYFTDSIRNGKMTVCEGNGKSNWDVPKEVIEVSVNEYVIQNALPDGHPDKIKTSTKDRLGRLKERFNSKTFPAEGSCKVIDGPLIDYLYKKCPSATVEKYPNSIGVAWNFNHGGSWWYFRGTTSKKEYTESELLVIIGVKRKEMNPDQLLEEAKRRYPIGTSFVPFNRHIMNGNPKDVTVDIENHYYYSTSEIWVSAGRWNASLYKDGKWAEIISKPEEKKEKVKEFKVGDRVHLVELVSGCKGANGKYGIIIPEDTKAPNGIGPNGEYKVRLESKDDTYPNGVWSVSGKIELAPKEKTIEDFYNCKIWLGEETSTALKEKVCTKLMNLGVNGAMAVDNKRGLALFIGNFGKVICSNSYDKYVQHKSKAITLEDLGMEPEKKYVASCDMAGKESDVSSITVTKQKGGLFRPMSDVVDNICKGGIPHNSIRGHNPGSIIVDDLYSRTPESVKKSFDEWTKYLQEKMFHSMRMPTHFSGLCNVVMPDQRLVEVKSPSLDKDGILPAPISKKKKKKVKLEVFAKPEIVELKIKKRKK
jgi:hypothetical protein